MKRQDYVVIKELPDAGIGTKVIWDEDANTYFYYKSAYVTPNHTAFLTAGQVTQTPELFKPYTPLTDLLELVKSFSPRQKLLWDLLFAEPEHRSR